MRALFVSALVSFTIGCGGAPSSSRCASSSQVKCLTNEVCSTDPKQGCQVCHCEDPGYQPIGKENPPSGSPPPGP